MLLNRTPWIIVGCGRVGKTLALLAGELGIEVRGIWNRDAESSEAAREVTGLSAHRHGSLPQSIEDLLRGPAIVWLTLVDTHLPEAARVLAPALPADALVLHTSGSLDASLLREAGIKGPVGSVHPLQAITDPHRALERLGASTWAVEGDPEAMAFAESLLAAIAVEPLKLKKGKKIYYHAAAVTAANLLVSLLDAAIAIAEEADISEEDARNMLVSLAQSSVENLREQPPAQALSGPVARGDEQTIAAHREALRCVDDPSLLEIYDVLTARARKLRAK